MDMWLNTLWTRDSNKANSFEVSMGSKLMN